MTKVTAFALILCVSVPVGPALSDPIGFGMLKCSEAGEPNEFGYRAALVNWVAGYASGLDAADGRFRDLQTLTSDEIFYSVIGFCSRNPSLTLRDAADSLLSKLH
jgi:hypothetical protein